MKKILLVSLMVLSGCASAPNHSASETKAGMAACMALTHQSHLLLVEIPSAGNALSDKLLVATIKMSGSNSVDNLVDVLSLPSRSPVVAYGSNDEVVAATLEAALAKLPSNTARSAEPLCFIGDSQFVPALQKAAASANIPFLSVH